MSGSIQLSGLLSGIDTSSLISQLMAVESRTLNIYKQRQQNQQSKIDALNNLKTKLDTLKSSISALSNSDKLRAFSAQTSDEDILTAEASYNAYEGNHTVVINRLATAERWVHTAGIEYAEDYVGEGTFIYSYNHKESVITTTDSTTLEDLAGLINNDANNPGVTASLLYFNGNYHLVLNGKDAGTDYEISINPYNTEVRQSSSELTQGGDNATLSTKITGLDQFDDSLGSLVGDERIHITGTKHDGTAVDVYMDVTENTKLSHVIQEINDAFGGTATATLENGRIVLTDHTCNTSPMTLTLGYDKGTGHTNLTLAAITRLTEGGTVEASLDGFDEAGFSETQSAQDSQIRVDGFPPGDWITKSSNTIDDVIQGLTLHLHNTTDENGVDVTLTRDIATVKDKISKMVNAYNLVVNNIKDNTGYDTATKTAGLLMGDYVVSTIGSLIRTPLVAKTNGFIEDTDTYLMPGQIGLQLDKDGLLNFDTNIFDEAIAKDYLGTLAIIGADKTGSSNSNIIEFYGADSKYTTAGNYDVQVEVSGGVISHAWIKLSTESTYRAATVVNNVIIGNSSFDENGDPVYPENGLQLSVDTSTDNPSATATINVKQGFAGAIDDVLDKILKTTNGSMQIDTNNANDTIDYIKEKITNEQERLDKKQTYLVARFARLEKTLALLQGQMSALGLSSSSP
jgi:flagellar hook-associated protein 2